MQYTLEGLVTPCFLGLMLRPLAGKDCTLRCPMNVRLEPDASVLVSRSVVAGKYNP